MDNAVRHCNEGDRVVIDLQLDGAEVEVSIRDTGLGIPESDVEHLFEPHFRAENSVKGRGGHSGLGCFKLE